MYLDEIDPELEKVVTEEGNILIKEAMGEFGLNENSLVALNERNIIKLDKKSKLTQFAMRSATIIAREKGDALYKKMAFHRRKFLEYRELIRKKYATKAIQRAKFAVRTGSLTDPNKKEPTGSTKF
jgi:hypothetical protein